MENKGMLNRLDRNISLIGLIGLLGLFLTCTQSKGTETRKISRSETATIATIAASPDAMSNMSMPSQLMSAAPKNMQGDARIANRVVIENFSFAPATLTVNAGTKVTWINHDNEPHTVDENDKRFKSGAMDTNDQFSYTFSSPGTFGYFCALHPKMTGQIIVK